jgi:hypothetical protein
MDFDKVKKALLKYNYLCIRLDSNFQVLEQLRTEKDICILGEDIPSKEFLSDLKDNFKKYSLLYFHDFQRDNIFDQQLMKEWNKLYQEGGIKLPYLLVSTFSLYYSPVSVSTSTFGNGGGGRSGDGGGLVFDKDRFLDFSKGNPVISYSSINYPEGVSEEIDQALYDRMCDIIVHDMTKKEGYRGLAIVPNLESQQYVSEKLHDLLPSEYVIKFLPDDIPDSAFFTPEKAKKYTHNFVFISLDLTHQPIFLTEIDVVYDSGEKDQNYETRAGFNRLKTVKINRQEMKARMMSYAPQFYMIMFPKTSILSLEKYFTPDVNNDIDVLDLINLGLKPSGIPKNLEKYGLVRTGKEGHPIITEKGKFCRAITIPIRHSSFIYEGMTRFRDLIKTVVVLVSIFINIDIYQSCVPFEQIYLSVFRKVSGGEVECPQEIISSIEELSKALEIDSKILDSRKQFNLILPHLKQHYRHNILKYHAGKWEDGSGSKYTLSEEGSGSVKISPTILPLTTWRNEKGEKYVGHYLPIVSMGDNG